MMSRHADWNDRATCVLFGDGAGAVVLSRGDGLLSIKTCARGAVDILNIEGNPGNSPFAEQKKTRRYLYMNGPEVYKFAVSSMCNDLREVIADANLTEDDIDFVLPHQANIKIIEAAKNRLKIPKDRYCHNIERFGNTSAASIPILLDEMNREGKLKNGQILALAAFGGGLTSAACILKWQ